MTPYVTAGVDESDESLAAAHWAAREALRRGAALRLVHAWTGRQAPEPSVPLDTTRPDEAEETLQWAVRSVRAAHPGLEAAGRLESGSPVTVLLAAAEDADVLVLGSRGLGRVAGFVVGSVSQRVIARSTHPVVLVRAGDTCADEHLPPLDGVSPEEIPETPFREVVLGLGTRHPASGPVEFAFEAARRRDTALRVVHAVPGVAHGADGRVGPESAAQPPAEREHLVADRLSPWYERFPSVPVTLTITADRPATELVRASAHASLVVVGRGAPDARLGPRIGSVAHAVLHHVCCPVAVVPE
ncbi:universal stress protein [Streptomyces sp. NPDC047022]|uniref:universal stress protein n=1 Tax=Streptomyces sp. NPDC047022 TaxID=3155737 RepID=UPI0033DF18C8